MYFLYVLKCHDGTLYTGITVDLDRRLAEHNSSKIGAKYTRTRRPVKIIYSKKYRTRVTASKAEYHMKQQTRAEKLRAIKA